MNRAAVRDFQAPGITVPRGELLVPTQVGDPARGSLACPAGPLLAGSLARKGWRSGSAPIPQLEDPAYDTGGAVVYLATCPQRDGSTAALAVAASPDDRLAMSAAKAAVAEWAAVTGTRRLLTGGSPWCGGALRALEMARGAVTGAERAVHVFGELSAPPEAAADLKAGGAAQTGSLGGTTPGDIVIFPAQGVPPEVRAQALQLGLDVVDATCPLVARAQEQVVRLAGRGDDLVLIGQAEQPTTAGITGQAPGRVALVETAAGTAGLQVADARRVSYLLQPGTEVEAASAVAAALRSRFPAMRGPDPDSFCYAPSDRAQTVRAIAAATDLMLVLGEADSTDARYLLGVARDCGARTQVLARTGDLAADVIGGVGAIGMVVSTSAASALPREMTAALSGLGVLSVVSRRVSSEIMGRPPERETPKAIAATARPAAAAQPAVAAKPARPGRTAAPEPAGSSAPAPAEPATPEPA